MISQRQRSLPLCTLRHKTEAATMVLNRVRGRAQMSASPSSEALGVVSYFQAAPTVAGRLVMVNVTNTRDVSKRLSSARSHQRDDACQPPHCRRRRHRQYRHYRDQSMRNKASILIPLVLAVVMGPLGLPLTRPSTGHSSRALTARLGLAHAQEYVFDRPQFTNANPEPFSLENPDGTTTPPITLIGSPHYYRMEDEEGYTILVDPEDGFVKYADIDGQSGRLVATVHKVGGEDPETGEKVDPKKLRLTRRAQPSKEVIAADCGQFCIDEVDSKEGPPKEKPSGGKGKCRGLICSLLNSRRLSGSTFGSVVGSMLRGSGSLQDEERDNNVLEDSSSTVVTLSREEQRERDFDLARRQLAAEREDRQRKLSGVKDGKMLNLVIPIQFADHPRDELPPESVIQTLFNAVNGHQTVAPTGSIRDAFYQSSYGQLTVVSSVVPWIKLPQPQKYYAGGKSGFVPAFQEALTGALDFLENNPNFSFKDFDANNDGRIDAITYVHSGYGAEWGGQDCTASKSGVGDRIWSHKWRLAPKTWTSKKDGVEVVDYHISPALHGRCGYEMGHVGTIVHELGHFLGLPDLYGGNANPGNGIGNFGMMGNSWGWDSTQLYPPIMSPWAKMEMGWLQPEEITKSDRYTLSPSAVNPKAYKISQGFPDGEYILIENRQPLLFDEKMPHGGIVMWHIDELALHNVEGGYPGKEGWPESGKHYRVSLIQADGSYSLEQGKDRGDAGHMYVPGQWLSQDIKTYPSTASYQGGVLKATGFRVFDIKEVKIAGGDTNMQFSVMFAGQPMPPTVVPTQAPTFAQVQYRTESRNIMSTFSGGSGSYGNMFDVKAVREVKVTHMAIHTRYGPSDPAMDIEVYTKKGTFIGSEYGAASWTKICCSEKITGAGLAKRSMLPESAFSSDVTIEEGEIQAFYVTGKQADIRYSKGTGMVGDILNGNLDIQILNGNGVGFYPFGGHVENRPWNGIIFYDTEVAITGGGDGGGDGPLVAAPTIPPVPPPTPVFPTPRPPIAPASTPTVPPPAPTNPPPSPATFDGNGIDFGPTKSLKSSSFSGNSGSYGNHFEMITFKPMAIRSLDFHTDLTEATRVQVWTRQGSYIGYERDASAWRQVCDTVVTGKGYMNLTPIPEQYFSNVYVDKGSKVSFYITLETPNLRYTKGDTGTSNGGINTDIQIYPGAGVGQYPFGSTLAPRNFNGAINYAIESVPTPAPTAEPTMKPVQVPTQSGGGPTGTGPSGGAMRDLQTTFASGNGGYGAFFDIAAKPTADVIVKTLDFHTDFPGSVKVSVYTLEGSYVNSKFDSSPWKLVCETSVQGAGYYSRTSIPETAFKSVHIVSGQVQGFYVVLDKPALRYSDAAPVGTVFAEDDHIEIRTGAGVALEFFSGIYEPRMWNGAVKFVTMGATSTPMPTPRPVSEPTGGVSGFLGTTLEAGSGSYGVIFDLVIAKGSPGVRVDSLDFYTDRTYELTFEVWTTKGSVLSKPFPDPSWELISRATVLGAGKNELTPIPPSVFSPVPLDQATPIRGFLVVLTTPDMRYTPDPNGKYAPYKSNEHFAIMVGDGVTSYPFRGNTRGATSKYRIFNGVVRYTEL